MSAARSFSKRRRERRSWTAAEMAAVLADPRNLERWRKRTARYVDTNACWIWTRTERLAGAFLVFVGDERRQMLAPRMSLLVKLGRPFEGFACHDCDRPGCVNPVCLWEGTGSDNMRDAAAKGRLGKKRYSTEERIERKRRSIELYERRLERACWDLADLIEESEREAALKAQRESSARPMEFGDPEGWRADEEERRQWQLRVERIRAQGARREARRAKRLAQEVSA